MGTARSVHAAVKGVRFLGAIRAPWDSVGSPQFFAGSAVFEGGARHKHTQTKVCATSSQQVARALACDSW